jgi:PAS domain S-box-containing protein
VAATLRKTTATTDPPIAGHLAREAILDTMSDAVVVVDRKHRVLDANRAAERTFGIDRGDASGRSVTETVGIEAAAESRDPLTLETTTGRRQFEVRRRSLSDSRGTLVGYAYRLRDVTDRQTREQRLEVLNRVLRHNLRNDLDAIRGFAEQLRATDAGADLDAADLAGTIRQKATDLAELGATVERAERIHSRGMPERTRIELVELEHSDSDDPAVEIALEQTDDGASIEVRDNGPGIPDREQTVLLEGEETPLQHGSGVGLWLAHWGVTRLGGTLSFTENEPRGSIVRVYIPS